VCGPAHACFTPGTPGGDEIVTPLLPPVPPVEKHLTVIAGSIGGKFGLFDLEKGRYWEYRG
jgi:hypothetical protein